MDVGYWGSVAVVISFFLCHILDDIEEGHLSVLDVLLISILGFTPVLNLWLAILILLSVAYNVLCFIFLKLVKGVGKWM